MSAARGWIAGLAAGLTVACTMAALQAPRPGAPRIDAAVDSVAVPWTGLAPLDDPRDFRFVVVSDRTGEHRPGVFRDAMPKINLVRPAFVVSVGDLIEGYTEEIDRLENEWDEIDDYVGRLRMPFFYAAGNHDMSNRVMADVWRDRYGPTYYHFRYKGVLFVVLNSELFGMVHDFSEPLPSAETLDAQLGWLEQVLAENRDARWTMVFVHQPLWQKREVHERWLEVEDMLGRRDYTVFAGHFHQYTRTVRRDRSFITLATTGGGSRLRGTVFGEFDHVALVTVSDDGPVIANLMLDGIHGDDVRTVAVKDTARALERVVRVDPIRGEGDSFRAGTARFSIHNPVDAALEVEASFRSRLGLRVALEDARRSIAPGESATIEVPLGAEPALDWDAITPAEATFTLTTRSPDDREVVVETGLPILPERVLGVPRARGPVEIDGDLGDWPELRLTAHNPAEIEGAEHWHGSADASFRWDVAHDDDWLYLAIDVTDDSPVHDVELGSLEQDRARISIDARPDPERSENEDLNRAMRNGNMRKLIMPSIGPVEPREDMLSDLFMTPPPEGTRTASRRTGHGYTVELAVPARALDERQEGPWRALRINVSVADFDADEPGHSVISWRPGRFGPRAVPASGTFERE